MHEEINDQDNNKPLGKDSISHLIELMETSNKSSHEIERDGRNSRRHLFDIKKTQMVLADMQAKTVYGFENFQEMIDSQSLQGLEDEKENKTVFQEMRDHLKDISENTGKGGGGSGSDSGGGFMSNFMGGFGSIAGSVMGIGALGAAIPLFFGGLLGGEAIIEKSVGDMGNIDFGTTKKLVKEFGGIIDVMTPGSMATLATLLAAATFSGQPLKTALGMGMMGAAISSFFLGLLAGETVTDLVTIKSGANFDSFKGLTASFTEAIKPLDKTSSIALAGLLVAGGVVGYAAGDFTKVALVAAGMGAMGAGIGGFFAGLGVGAEIGSFLTSGFDALPNMVGAFADSVKILKEKEADKALVAILGAGAGLGAFLKGGKQALMVTGMTAMGAGIGGFFLGFDGLASIGAAIGADGSNAKNLITNFAEGINAFDQKSLTALGALLAVGGIAGPKGSAWLAAGLTVMGIGLAGFFTAFDGVAGLAGILGADGSSTKNLLTNFAEGINALVTGLPEGMTGRDLQDLGLGLGAIGIGMVALLGADGLGGLKGIVEDVFNFLTLGFFEDDRTIFEILRDSLGPLNELDNDGIKNASEIFGSLGTFLTGVNKDNMKDNVDATTEALKEMGLTLEDVFVDGFGDTSGNKIPLNKLKDDIDAINDSLETFKERSNLGALDIVIAGQKDISIPSMAVTNLSIENAMLKLPEGATGNNNFLNAPVVNNNQSSSVIVTSGSDALRNAQTGLRTDG